MQKAFLFILSFIFQCFIIAQTPIAGFNDSTGMIEQRNEKLFDSLINRENIGRTIKELSAIPHNLGSAGSKIVAENIKQKFISYGFEVHTDVYQVLFPTPKIRILEMTVPVSYKAVLKEPALKEDGTSGQADQLPTYNAWSADGDVTAELVYVNYGLNDDYETLERLGISVKGKIVIAKYGHSWRGIKPKIAQEHGAIGCIIYSDPKDDGYYRGDVYPKGPFKNEYGVQRGSVMDMVVYPGDPLTPEIGATAGAKRISSHEDAKNLLKIPVLPISYHDARPLLENLGGPVAPDSWSGALPITYHIGPGKSTVHLKLSFDWKIVPCYDVIAMIKGSEYPDEWVIRGNHHDAWVNGAQDPISGQASLLEEAKAMGQLLKSGWRPKRTMVYCAWDGEEPALVGSTEWVEDHAEFLQQHAVVYINSDESGRGFLNAGGSHALEGMVDEVSRGIKDPQTGVSIFERKMAHDITTSANLSETKDLMDHPKLKLDALGTGSDFSPFLQHLGVPSLDVSFSGEDASGDYHSIYDSYDNYIRFVDPGFYYNEALSKMAGHISLRMADAGRLPFDFRSLQQTIKTYADELQSILLKLRESTTIDNNIIRNHYLTLSADPTKPFVSPKPKPEVPFIDFSPLENAISNLGRSAEFAYAVSKKDSLSNKQIETINQRLYQSERNLLLEQGLPLRPWYRHSIYAPGFYTGYSVKTLPGIREAIEQRDYKQAETEIRRAADAINKLSAYLAAF